MSTIDIFNGDADGLCALHQLRLADPADSQRITGVKRDISLLARVSAGKGDVLTVLDISLDKNRADLSRLLDAGCRVRYFDHHFAGEIPESKTLEAHIYTDSNTCTSLIVNRYLKGAYLPWAVTGAFGDNLHDSAKEAAVTLNYSDADVEKLRELGTLLNYNGYGMELSDLLYHPDELYSRIQPYLSPFDFIDGDHAFKKLRQGFESDMDAASELIPQLKEEKIVLYVLPDKPWARRVSGVLGNQLARDNPNVAHALLTHLNKGGYQVSVRSPLANKTGADELCRGFLTGGGRKAAAGINYLPEEMVNVFIERFKKMYCDKC
jgi:hypothetical protein